MTFPCSDIIPIYLGSTIPYRSYIQQISKVLVTAGSSRPDMLATSSAVPPSPAGRRHQHTRSPGSPQNAWISTGKNCRLYSGLANRHDKIIKKPQVFSTCSILIKVYVLYAFNRIISPRMGQKTMQNTCEPRKKNSYFPLYWLFNKDYHDGLW